MTNLDTETESFFEESKSLAEQYLRDMEKRGEINSSEKKDLLNHYIWQLFFREK